MWLRRLVGNRVAVGACILCVYIAIGFLYRAFEPWSYIDTVYFSIATLSTVGYGDLSPSSSGSRAFTILMLTLGVGVVFPVVANVASKHLTEPFTGRCRAYCDKIFPPQYVDIEGDGSGDYSVPGHPLKFYSKNIAPSLLLNLLLQLASAGIFCAIEDMDYGSALYHCIVTAATVGYGDVPIVTDGGKVW